MTYIITGLKDSAESCKPLIKRKLSTQGLLYAFWALAGILCLSGCRPETSTPAVTAAPLPVDTISVTSTAEPISTTTPAATIVPTATPDLVSIEQTLQTIFAEPQGFDSLADIPAYVSESYDSSEPFERMVEVFSTALNSRCGDGASCLRAAYQNLPAGPTRRLDLPEPGEAHSDITTFTETETLATVAGNEAHTVWRFDTPAGEIYHLAQDDNVVYYLWEEGAPERYIPRIRAFLAEELAAALNDASDRLQAEGYFLADEVVGVNQVYRNHWDVEWTLYFWGENQLVRQAGNTQHTEGFAVDLRIYNQATGAVRSIQTSDLYKLIPIINEHGFMWGEHITDRPHITYLGVLDANGDILLDGVTAAGVIAEAGYEISEVQQWGWDYVIQSRPFYEQYRLAVAYVLYQEAQKP